jgi:hypothetical protein
MYRHPAVAAATDAAAAPGAGFGRRPVAPFICDAGAASLRRRSSDTLRHALRPIAESVPPRQVLAVVDWATWHEALMTPAAAAPAPPEHAGGRAHLLDGA